MPDERADEMTLRLLKAASHKLSEDRRRDVLAQHDLVVQLLRVSDDESGMEVAQELLRDAL